MKKLFLFIAVFVLLAFGCATQQGQLITDGPTTLLEIPVIKPDIPQPPMRLDLTDLVRRLEALENKGKPTSLEEIKKLAAKAGASNFYGTIARTGGTSGSLDNIDGTNLATGDAAYCVESTGFRVYYLNATLGGAESDDTIISPDASAGTKRWELVFRGDLILGDIARLTPTDGNIIVGNNTTWVAESENTARTSLGLGTGDSPTFTALNTGQGAYELFAMDQDTEQADSPIFVTTKLSGLGNGFIPYHIDDATGLADGPMSTDGTNTTVTGETTFSPDGTNKTFKVKDGTMEFNDGAGGTTGTLTIDSSGNWSYNKSIDSPVFTTQFTLNSLITKQSSQSVNDEAEITLATGVTGWGIAQAGDNEEWIQFSFTAAGVVTVIANSANAVNADTDGNLCVYDAGSGIRIKNRLGATKTIRYVVNYS